MNIHERLSGVSLEELYFTSSAILQRLYKVLKHTLLDLRCLKMPAARESEFYDNNTVGDLVYKVSDACYWFC